VDALCVELAHRLELPLITTDRRLARVTPLAAEAVA
jgi:predicted nucleic acid-binding protein